MIGYKITIPFTSDAQPHSLEYNLHELRLCIGFLNAMQDGILQSGNEDYWLRQAVYFAHKCENALIREAKKWIKGI